MLIVVSDTSPISALLQIRQVDLLRDLYRSVCIPMAVHSELLRMHAALPAFLTVHRARDTGSVVRLLARVDQGEAEAIILAEELGADLILMDERIGRKVATEHGLAVVGLLGVLVSAKHQGLIPSVGPVIRQLETAAHFYVSPVVQREALEQAGEHPGKMD